MNLSGTTWPGGLFPDVFMSWYLGNRRDLDSRICFRLHIAVEMKTFKMQSFVAPEKQDRPDGDISAGEAQSARTASTYRLPISVREDFRAIRGMETEEGISSVADRLRRPAFWRLGKRSVWKHFRRRRLSPVPATKGNGHRLR